MVVTTLIEKIARATAKILATFVNLDFHLIVLRIVDSYLAKINSFHSQLNCFIYPQSQTFHKAMLGEVWRKFFVLAT